METVQTEVRDLEVGDRVRITDECVARITEAPKRASHADDVWWAGVELEGPHPLGWTNDRQWSVQRREGYTVPVVQS